MEKPSIPWQFCDCLWLFGMTSLVKGSSAVVNISKSAEVVVVVVDFNLLEEVSMPALVKSLLGECARRDDAVDQQFDGISRRDTMDTMDPKDVPHSPFSRYVLVAWASKMAHVPVAAG